MDADYFDLDASDAGDYVAAAFLDVSDTADFYDLDGDADEAHIPPTVVQEDDGVIVNAHDESDYLAAYFHLDDGVDGDAADAVWQRARATRTSLPQGIQRRSEAWGKELAKLRWSKRITDEQKRCACSLWRIQFDPSARRRHGG